MELNEYWYDQFLEQLDYDKEIARRMYPEWKSFIKTVFSNQSWSFFLTPNTNPVVYDILEFIDGNGFTVEREEMNDTNDWIHIEIIVHYKQELQL